MVLHRPFNLHERKINQDWLVLVCGLWGWKYPGLSAVKQTSCPAPWSGLKAGLQKRHVVTAGRVLSDVGWGVFRRSRLVRPGALEQPQNILKTVSPPHWGCNITCKSHLRCLFSRKKCACTCVCVYFHISKKSLSLCNAKKQSWNRIPLFASAKSLRSIQQNWGCI